MDKPSWSFGRGQEIDAMLVELGLQTPTETMEDGEYETLPDPTSDEEQTEEPFEEEEISFEEMVEGITAENEFFPSISHEMFDGVEQFEVNEVIWPYELLVDHEDALELKLAGDPIDDNVFTRYLSSAELPEGLILFSASGVLSNRYITRPGHQRWLQNYLNLYVAESGSILFDDFHQGLASVYDAGAFFSDARFWYSVLAMFVVWFLYMVFYASRFGPIALPTPGIDSAEFPHRVGNLLARHLDPRELNLNLLQAFENHYCRLVGLPLSARSMSAGSTFAGSIDLHLTHDFRFSEADVEDYRTLESRIRGSARLEPSKVQAQLAALYQQLEIRK
jgi:hypothetical protein